MIVGQIYLCLLFFNINLSSESIFLINGKSKITSTDFSDVRAFCIISNFSGKN